MDTHKPLSAGGECVVIQGGEEGRAGSEGDSNGPLSVGIFRLKLACLCDLQHSYRHKHVHMTGRSI